MARTKKQTAYVNAAFDEAKETVIKLLEAIIGKEAVEKSGIKEKAQ